MLPTGTRLGPYEIVAPLGAGGMGEVYRARDTRLGRDVAVKVLPAHLSANPEVRARFEREARTVSSLNHPNICTLFDVGREGETDFLVMELVEGDTLSAHLRRGAMPAAELLRLGAQVAEALERAHRAGVIHRDLKPSNIMITKSGAKLMDFGLARATGMSGPGGASGVTMAALTQSPTVGHALTAEGTLLGTYQYMSPEQLEGHEADARSDVWALGCVLYEMATGRRAFEGRSQASLIAAILEREPAPVGEGSSASASGAGGGMSAAGGPPAGLDGLIRDCLAKDPDERVQTAHDVRLRLQRIAQSAGLSISSAALPPSSPGSSGSLAAPVIVRKASPLPWLVAAALLVALGGFAAFAWPRLSAKPPVYRFQPDVSPPGVTSSWWPRLSPDGRQLLFQGADSANVTRAYVLRLDESAARPIVGTEGLQRAYWSPNAREIVFCAGGRMLRLPVEGGSPTVICPAPGGADLSWGRKGVILMDGNTTDSLRQVPAGGGELRPASRIDRKAGERGAAWPCFLPDGERFLFVGNIGGGSSYGSIRIGRLGSLESKKIGETSGRVEYAPGGWLVFPKGPSLVAQKLDESRLELTGQPIVLCEDITTGGAMGHFSTSPAGPLAMMRGESGGEYELRLADRSGALQPGVITSGTIANPQFSPDGHRVLYERRGPTSTPYGDVYVHDLDRDVDTRLTFTDGYAVGPRWSPDGRRFAVTIVSGKGKILIGQADGMGAVDSLVSPGPPVFLAQWAAGDRIVAFDNASGTWVADFSKASPAFTKVPGCAEMVQPMFSPDGGFVAGVLGRQTLFNVFVQSLGGQPGRWQISSATMGFFPRWTKGGRELLFETRDGHVMSVECDMSHGFRAGTPKPLFALPASAFSEYVSTWIPGPDGSRFILVTPAHGRTAARSMEIVTRFDVLVNR